MIDDEFVSKSQRKRDAQRVQQLGESLLTLPMSDLEALPLPADVLAALLEAKRLKKHGALRRQLQYIGKLMRNIDCEPLFAALTARGETSAQENTAFHNIEHWRDYLIGNGDIAVEELLAARPQANRKQMRQYVRQAKHEQESSKPPKAARSLFRYLRELDGVQTLPEIKQPEKN